MDGKMQAKYRIGKEKPALIIHAVDIVKNGVKEEQWIKFFNISTWIHNANIYPAIGNHDLPYASFKKYFSLPNNEQWYSFNYGCAHFTILDSNSFSLPQLLWLINDLGKPTRWKIVVFHHPIISYAYINPLLLLWHIYFSTLQCRFCFQWSLPLLWAFKNWKNKLHCNWRRRSNIFNFTVYDADGDIAFCCRKIVHQFNEREMLLLAMCMEKVYSSKN